MVARSGSAEIRPCGLEVGHAIGHELATRMGEAGIDNKAIAEITGHSYKSIENILEIYMLRTAQLSRDAFRQRLAAEAERDIWGE